MSFLVQSSLLLIVKNKK